MRAKLSSLKDCAVPFSTSSRAAANVCWYYYRKIDETRSAQVMHHDPLRTL